MRRMDPGVRTRLQLVNGGNERRNTEVARGGSSSNGSRILMYYFGTEASVSLVRMIFFPLLLSFILFLLSLLWMRAPVCSTLVPFR